MGMRKSLQKTLMLTVIAVLAVSVATGISAAKQSSLKPLSISFSTPLPQTAYSQIDYTAKIAWTNPNSVAVAGSLLFTVAKDNGKINTADITLSYKGLAIKPQLSANTLLFYIPQQSFDGGKSGNFIVTVTYNAGGSYNWQIGVVQ
jgi:hypothetical protein